MPLPKNADSEALVLLAVGPPLEAAIAAKQVADVATAYQGGAEAVQRLSIAQQMGLLRCSCVAPACLFA
jgi:hypothetical protein